VTFRLLGYIPSRIVRVGNLLVIRVVYQGGNPCQVEEGRPVRLVSMADYPKKKTGKMG